MNQDITLKEIAIRIGGAICAGGFVVGLIAVGAGKWVLAGAALGAIVLTVAVVAIAHRN